MTEPLGVQLDTLDMRWEAEAVRLYRRYESEVVDANEFCPWASRVRREGRLAELVFLQRDAEAMEPSLVALERLPAQIELALLLYPRVSVKRDAFEHFSASVRDTHLARAAQAKMKDPFVFVVFHPDAQPHMEEAARFIPFLRRSPDATIQVVRSSVLERVRATVAEGTQFVDPRFLDSWQPRPPMPTLRERIAIANLETTQRIGLGTLTHQIEDIIRDRDETYAGLEGRTAQIDSLSHG